MVPILTDPRLVASALVLALIAWAFSTRQRIRRNRRRWMVFQRARDAMTAPSALASATTTITGKRDGAPSVSAPETPNPLGLQGEQ